MKHVVSALCGRVVIDQTTQNVTLVDLVDSLLGPINETAEGAFSVALDFLTVWMRTDLQRPETGRARLGVLNATRVLIHPHLEYEVDLVAAHRARNITRFPVFPFRGTGLHTITVEIEVEEGHWQVVAEWPILISVLAANPVPAAV